jgi:hypothetical protein
MRNGFAARHEDLSIISCYAMIGVIISFLSGAEKVFSSFWGELNGKKCGEREEIGEN